MSVVQFPKKEDNVLLVIDLLKKRYDAGQLKAIVCLTMEETEEEGKKMCVLNGWEDGVLSTYDQLALCGALGQVKRAVEEELEVS